MKRYSNSVSKLILFLIAIILSILLFLVFVYETKSGASIKNLFSGSLFIVLLMSIWIYFEAKRKEAEDSKSRANLKSLSQATLEITTELEMSIVLQKIVNICKELIPSEFAVLGILNESESFYKQFITSGIDSSEEKKWTSLDVGVLKEEWINHKVLRINSIDNSEEFSEIFVKFPKIKNVVGISVNSKSRKIGNLFLINRESDEKQFSKEDQRILEMFSKQAGIVIENAKLFRQTKQMAVLQERERFGMDLHDGVIQSIYAVGLMLEDIRSRLKGEHESAYQGLSTAIVSLNNAINDLRTYILNLRPHHFQNRNLVEGVEELARALRANTFMTIHVEMDGIETRFLTSEDTSELLHIIQEALSNTQKHARASEVELRAEILENTLFFRIIDNGISISQDMIFNSDGNGINNMRERADTLGGSIEIGNIETGGTEILIKIPVKA